MYRTSQRLTSIVVVISFCLLLLLGEGYAAAPTVKLVINPDTTEVYAGADLIAIATQASGSNLTYKWDLLGPGKLEGEGPGAFYHVPEKLEKDSARALITVTVIDGTGQETTATAIFNIFAHPAQEQPPTSESTPKPESPTPPQELPSTTKPESKGISKRTKLILGGVVTAAAIGGGVALLAGGGNDGGDDSGDDDEPDTSLSGTWTGVLTSVGGKPRLASVSFVLFQDGNDVTGYGKVGVFNVDSITGTNVYPDVSLTLEPAGYNPAYFIGRFSDKDTVSGNLSDAGFANDPLTLRRQ